MNTVDAWIEKGYEHFALVGPINFSVKKISEVNNLSRTTFNYHFGSQKEFIDELLAAHQEFTKIFVNEAKTTVKKYIPDLHILLNKFETGVRFQLQLFNHRYNPEFDRIFRLCNKQSSDNFLVERFVDYYQLTLTIDQATKIHDIVVESWYSRLNINEITVATMIESTNNLMDTLIPLLNK